LLFDYHHMTDVSPTFDHALEMLERWSTGGEEHMVISLGSGLRIETPFTSDVEQVRSTLRRMREDPDLYAGNHSYLTERRFFDRLETIFDLLEHWPGRKMVVLFSGPFQPDGFYYDPQFKRLSALATATRTALYPVDTGGLRTDFDSPQPFGGPPMLNRLALETGGRMTADTNDIGLAYAKARRDLSCIYTLGFDDASERPDRQRRLTIRVRDRSGLRVVYPEYYVVRSADEKRRAAARTAALVPQFFESDDLATSLVVLGPRSPSRWDALLAVRFHPPPGTAVDPAPGWELRGFVRKPNGTAVHSFRREIPAAPAGLTVERFHEITLRPGRYLVGAVVSGAASAEPLGAAREVEIPQVPRGQPFLIGPLLGRRSEVTFEPLLGQTVERGARLEALTRVCVVDEERSGTVVAVERTLGGPGGAALERFPAASVDLGGEEPLACKELIDTIVTDALPPGSYEVGAIVETPLSGTLRGATTFTVVSPPGARPWPRGTSRRRPGRGAAACRWPSTSCSASPCRS
jgi:hypothetical protein